MKYEFVHQVSLALTPTGAYRVRGGKSQNPACGHQAVRSESQPVD
jgi:hypothetical protein